MSERGNSERGGTNEVEEKGNNGNISSNSNSNNNEAAEGAALDQHQRDHSGLLTVGEKCVHLICEVIRGFDCEENSHGVTTPDGAVTLSRLSRTCRTLYIYVRNLPSVLEQQQPLLNWVPLPWGIIALDIGYWSDIAGLVWEVSDPQQLLVLARQCHIAASDSRSTSAALSKLFLSFSFKFPPLCKACSASEMQEIFSVMYECGGLSFGFTSLSFAHPEALFDLGKCHQLRALDVLVTTEETGSLCALWQQLKSRASIPQSAAVSIMLRSSPGVDTVDLSSFSSFAKVAIGYSVLLCDLWPLERVPFVSLCANRFANVPAPDLRPLAKAHTVHLIAASVTDLRPLSRLHTLVLKVCASLTDVSALANIHTLTIKECRHVSDVSALAHIHTLTIRKCARVTDVSQLGNVHALCLRECTSITDVRALGNVHTLDLSYCKAVSDVSMLGRVHTLNLTSCSLVTDISALGGVHTLGLFSLSKVTDVSMLGNVHALDLSYCKAVPDVSMLGSVHSLNLTWCDAVSDVSALGRVCTLSLTGCDALSGMSALGGVHHLDLRGVMSLESLTKNIGSLTTVHSLALTCVVFSEQYDGDYDGDSKLMDVGELMLALGRVRNLTFFSCDWLTDVGALGTVSSLTLTRCDYVMDVSSLDRVEKLELRDCPAITNASTLIGKVRCLRLG